MVVVVKMDVDAVFASPAVIFKKIIYSSFNVAQLMDIVATVSMVKVMHCKCSKLN